MKINCPYIIFTTEDLIPILQSYRIGLPTHFISYPITDFITYHLRYLVQTHPIHCPSVDLNLIWNERIHMIRKAVNLDIFQSDWYMWVDAGINVFRDISPPPIDISSISKINTLPKNKLIYSSSNPIEAELVTTTRYYHHIASGTMIIHSGFISLFADAYYKYLMKLFDKNNIWTEQVILTHIHKYHPELFYKLTDGYGQILTWIYN